MSALEVLVYIYIVCYCCKQHDRSLNLWGWRISFLLMSHVKHNIQMTVSLRLLHMNIGLYVVQVSLRVPMQIMLIVIIWTGDPSPV